MDVFTFLLERRAPFVVSSATECFEALATLDGTFLASIDRAAAGGACADRLGYAFLAGYRAALSTLGPGLQRASLCATEEGGAHPRAIRSTLIRENGDLRLSGKKTFSTLASAADTLLVIASTSAPQAPEARNHLRAVRIPKARAGVVIRDRNPLPFAPEIPHAEITFTDVVVKPDELLPGDAYTGLLKPFRTAEDAHLTAAWLGYAARALSDRREKERALALVSALRALDLERSASSAETHVVLAGILEQAGAVATACDIMLDENARTLWQRDRPLLEVAGQVRARRRETAWAELAKRSEKTSFG